MTNVIVRRAEREDVTTVLGLIEELAHFEELAPPDEAAQQRFTQDGWPTNGKSPRFEAWLALVDTGNGVEVPAAYAITFETYSSFLAKPTLYLEDIFVRETFRRMSVGSTVMERLLAEAKARGCGRMDWVVLDWNTNAQRFYQRLGASYLTEWQCYRKDLTETNEDIGEEE